MKKSTKRVGKKISKKLGDLIRAARKEKDLKVKDLAAMADVMPEYITQVERQGIVPSHSTITIIAKKLENTEILDTYIDAKYDDVRKAIENIKKLKKELNNKKK